MTETIVHEIEPVFDEHSEVLVLGTMPSPKSREAGFYYGHPRNRFWTVMAQLFGEPVADTNERRRDQLLRHHIALWDVLAQCDIEGASDASIANAQPNDLRRITERATIRAIFCTGAKSAELYRRLCEPELGIPCVQLPSTSPANAAWSLGRLVESYRAILPHLHEASASVLPVADVVALEHAIADAGTSLAELMERAGLWLAFRVHALCPRARVAILCGNGNNGGDGWVAARYLVEWGHAVTLICAKPAEALHAEPARSAALATADSLSAALCGCAAVLVDPEDDAVRDALGAADIVVDALLGTGFAGETVKEPFATWIGIANEQRKRGAVVVAADVPSGLHADTGAAAATVVQADETVTMIVGKPGLFTERAKPCVGRVTIAPLAYLERL